MDDKFLQIKMALYTFADASHKLDRLLDERVKLYNRAVYKSPQFDKAGSRRNTIPDKFAEALASADQVEDQICRTAASLKEKYFYVRDLIKKLEPHYTTMIILQWHYINGMGWGCIADKLGLDVSYVRKLHRIGLQDLLEQFQKEVERDDE